MIDKSLKNPIINRIISIYLDNFPPYLRVRLPEFKKSLKDYKYIDLLKNDNNKVTGWALLNQFDRLKLLHLDYISLDKSIQGNGNGSRYLQKIIQKYFLENKKVKYMILECEEKLVKFYEKNNFKRIPYNYKYGDVPLNLMLYTPASRTDYNLSEQIKIAIFLKLFFTKNIVNPLNLIYIYSQNYSHSYRDIFSDNYIKTLIDDEFNCLYWQTVKNDVI